MIVFATGALSECFNGNSTYYKQLLKEVGGEEMLNVYYSDCNYNNNTITTFSSEIYEPANIDASLYGLINVTNNEVIAVSMNKTGLDERITEFGLDAGLQVTALDDTMTHLGGGDTVEKRDWSHVEYYALAYVGGGAALKLATQCTKHPAINKTYDMYLAIGALPFIFLNDLKNAITSAIYWEGSSPGFRGYYANSPMAGRRTMQGAIADIGSLAKRITPYDDFFSAPNIKTDLCTSKVNDLGWLDWDKLDSWGQWYADHLLNHWDGIGSCANHLYWDLSWKSYWIQSIEVRPNTEDADVSFKSCDDGSW